MNGFEILMLVVGVVLVIASLFLHTTRKGYLTDGALPALWGGTLVAFVAVFLSGIFSGIADPANARFAPVLIGGGAAALWPIILIRLDKSTESS